MSVYPLVYNIERGSGKDVFFGRQETYTAPACSPGDRTISCVDNVKQTCRSYSRIFGCCDAVDGGACGISVGCTHCEEVKTGTQTCSCEKAIPAPPPVGGAPGQGSLLPIGTAGASVIQGEGGGKKPNVAAILLVVLVLAGIGYIVYSRTKGAIRAAA